MRAQHEVGLRRTGAPSAVDHVAFAAAGLVVEQVAPRGELEHLQVHGEALLLHHRRDHLSVLLRLRIEADGGVVGDLGQALAVREAGLGEQRLTLLGVVLRIVVDLGVAELHRRDVRLRIGAGDAEHVEQHAAVDGVAGGLTDADVVEGRLRAAEEQVLVLHRHRPVDLEAVVLLDRVDLLLLEALDDVGLAVEQRKRAGRGVTDIAVFDGGDARLAEIEVRVRLHEGRIALLLDEAEGAGAVRLRRQLRLVGHVLRRHDRQER